MKKKSKKTKVSLRKLFWDDRFVIAFSFVIALFFWAAVCVSFSPNTTNTIKDVPIVIDTENSVPSKCGLHVFGDENFTVDIKVSGSRYVVGENLLTKDDFSVTAITSSVTTAGTHSLQLRVSKVHEDADFVIDEISENFISVYFDTPTSKEIPITVEFDNNINEDNYFVEDGYLTDDNYIIDNNTVVVSGPALEIAQLDSVVADLQIPESDVLSTVKTYSASLTAYGKNKTPLKYVKINGEENAVKDITVPIYKKSNYPLKVNFTNVPSSYVGNIDYSISPQSLSVAVLQNGAQINEIVLGTIDFSKISSGSNTFKFNVDDLKTVMPGSSNVKEVVVTVNFENVSSRYIKLKLDEEHLLIENLRDDESINFNEATVLVHVYGIQSDLDEITSENLVAKIDLKNNLSKDAYTYQGPISMVNSKTCWISDDDEPVKLLYTKTEKR